MQLPKQPANWSCDNYIRPHDDSKDADTEDSTDTSTEDKDTEAETETIKLTDLKEGDVVKIVLDADGNAKSITVIAEAPKADAKADDTKAADSTDDTSADTADAETEDAAK